jgi:hypothetical protein
MAASMLESVIGSPEDEEDDIGAMPKEMGDPKAKKKRAIKALFAAIKSGDADAGATAFADAVDACLEYGDDAED